MNTKSITIILVLLLALGAAVYVALRNQQSLENGLPPKDDSYAGMQEAYRGALEFSKTHGYGNINPVLGTGSMAPYIPPSAPGLDPYLTYVAYVTFKVGAGYKDIETGNLVMYKAAFTKPPGRPVLHCAAVKDKDGWIMSGLNNRYSEPKWRVTEENFLGIVESTHTWKQK